MWVCTLNTLLKDQCDGKARQYAQAECRELLKGGRMHPGVLAEIRSFDAEKQARYLAQSDFYTIRQEVLGKYPDPPEPQQGDLEAETYAKAVVKWEGECKAAAAKREKAEQIRYDAEVKKGLALTEKVRVERCVTAYFAQEFAKHFVARLRIETLYRATRLADDHSRRYFEGPEAVEDASDGVLDALTRFYFEELDVVRADAIPTSPAAS